MLDLNTEFFSELKSYKDDSLDLECILLILSNSHLSYFWFNLCCYLSCVIPLTRSDSSLDLFTAYFTGAYSYFNKSFTSDLAGSLILI